MRCTPGAGSAPDTAGDRSACKSTKPRQSMRRVEPEELLRAVMTSSEATRPSEGVDDGPQHDPALLGSRVAGASMHGRDLVPHEDVAHAPVVVVDEPLLRRVVAKLLDQAYPFVGRETFETVGMRGVDEQHWTSRHRMLPHGRMPTLGPLLLGCPNVGLAVELDGVGAVGATVKADQPLESAPHRLNQVVIGRTHVGEHRAA